MFLTAFITVIVVIVIIISYTFVAAATVRFSISDRWQAYFLLKYFDQLRHQPKVADSRQ